MKKLIFILMILTGFTAYSQDLKPVDANNKVLQTPNNPVFYYNTVNKKVGLWKGTYLYNEFYSAKEVRRMLDSLALAYNDTLEYYRQLSNHDSLSTLQEKSYNSLDDKPDLSVYLEASDITGKKNISDSVNADGYTRRDRLASELAKKVDKNTAITGATKIKITYDTKGLVTAGADATTVDIAPSTDRRYVTEDEKANLHANHANRTALDAVIGMNTGNQNLSLGSKTGTVQQLIIGSPTDSESGNMVEIDVADNDNDPENELQDLTPYRLKADTVTLKGTATNYDLSLKVDKVTGKGLSTEDYTTAEKTKLSGIADGANNYTHPANHAPSIITQDASNRFVSDTQISTWNGKQSAINGTGFVKASGTIISYDNSTYEPAFTKYSGFNLPLGTTAGTVLEGRTFGTAANSATTDFAPSSGSGNYVQVSPATPQAGNIWMGGDITNTNIGNNISNKLDNGTSQLYNQVNNNIPRTLFVNGNTGGVRWDLSSGMAGINNSDYFFYNNTNDIIALQLSGANGAATFSSSINAPSATFTTAKLTNFTNEGWVVKVHSDGTLYHESPSASEVYKGAWDASTNTPTLTNGTGTSGWSYQASSAGTVDFGAGDIAFEVGDYVKYNGSIWEYVEGVGYNLMVANNVLGGVKITPSSDFNIDATYGNLSLNSTVARSSLGVNNVENTALSTWSGTTNLSTLGTIGTGVWQGTAIADSYISSATTWNAKESALTFGTGLSRTGNTITNTITQYTDAMARSALSFTAGSGTYNSSTGVITIPTNTNQLTNGAGYITGITSGNVTTALGFTPYNSSNPAGYTSNTGTVTSVGVSVPTGLSVSGSPVTSSGTIAIGLQSGYSIPTTEDQEDWTDNMGKVWMGQGGYQYLNQSYFEATFDGYTTSVIPKFGSIEEDEFLPVTGNDAFVAIEQKQDLLSSGYNIKTINGSSILGSGNISISGGTTDHAALSNLSYAASNHTGFAKSAGDLSQAFNASSLTIEAGTYDWGISGSSGTLTFGHYGGNITFNNGGATFTGNITAAEGSRGSSRTLKHNIRDFDRSALDIILNTKIQEYNLNVDSSYGVGFIAENTDTILSGSDQKKHLFGNHLSVLTKAIQELHESNEKYKERIAEIELEIALEKQTRNSNNNEKNIFYLIGFIIIAGFVWYRTNK